MQPEMIKERAHGNVGTRHDGLSTKTHTNSKRARNQLKRKRKSQETIHEGGEGDPETRNINRRAPAAAKGTKNGNPTLNRVNGGAIQQMDRHSDQTRQSSRKANTSPDMLHARMMTELVENTQDDVVGEIFAHQAMFPDYEHDHVDPFLAYRAGCVGPGHALLPSSHEEPDRDKIESGMEKEIKDQFENGISP
jgi:hypothetical protein